MSGLWTTRIKVPDEQSGEQRAGKVMHELTFVACSLRLRDQASGRHAQEAEGPVDRIEKDASHGNTPQCRGAGQMAGKDRVYRGEQRLGEVRKNQRDGEKEDSSVPVGRSHLVGLFSDTRVSHRLRFCYQDWLAHVTNDAKAIVSVFEFRWNAGTRRASRDFDVVPPGASARCLSVAHFGSARIAIR